METSSRKIRSMVFSRFVVDIKYITNEKENVVKKRVKNTLRNAISCDSKNLLIIYLHIDIYVLL